MAYVYEVARIYFFSPIARRAVLQPPTITECRTDQPGICSKLYAVGLNDQAGMVHKPDANTPPPAILRKGGNKRFDINTPVILRIYEAKRILSSANVGVFACGRVKGPTVQRADCDRRPRLGDEFAASVIAPPVIYTDII